MPLYVLMSSSEKHFQRYLVERLNSEEPPFPNCIYRVAMTHVDRPGHAHD